MSSDTPLCHALPLFLLISSVIACSSSVQSTGAGVTYIMSKIAGNGAGFLKVNVPALEAMFTDTTGLAQSKNGDLYTVDRLNHIVLKFEFNSTKGTWSKVTVIAGTGTAGKGDDDIVGTQSALNNPRGLSLIEDSLTGAVTAILIADTNNDRIRKLDMSTRKITTIAGTGTSGFSGDDLLAKDAQLWSPPHVYYDKSKGDIYIADSRNKRIRRVRGGTITTVVGKTCGDSDGLGDGGQAVDACLNEPYYFTMNNVGEWFVVDRGSQLIRRVYLNGTITTVAGGGTETGDAPATSVKLSSLENIAFTPSGNLLVAQYSSESHLIRKMDHSGFMKVIAGGGDQIPSSNNPIPAKTADIRPRAIAYARDGSDAIFIGDNRGFIFKLTSSTKCYGVGPDNAAVCSGHGYCIGEDQCQCDVGWMGMDCSITHCFGVTSNIFDRVCSGRGKCVRPSKCHCDEGFRGNKCQHQVD